MNKKLLLFDGHSIANRAFYGVPLLTNKNGQYTNAIFGFLNMMLSIIEKEKPDYLGIAFDLSAPTFRHKFSEEYKGNRKGMPEELRAQMPLLKQVLGAMHIQIISKEGFEADDVLGTLAKEGEKNGMQVTVVSGDRDLFQITSDQIEIKIPRTKKTGTEIESFFAKDVIETYGVTPTEFVDVKGLMGDPSDNIKGVPGIGEKTAVKLIKEYGSIENLLDHVEDIKQKKLKENLTVYAQDARDSKMLAKIVCDVPLEYSWESFEFDLMLDEEANELFQSLELKSILNKLPRKTLKEEQAALEIKESSLDDFKQFLRDYKNQTLSVSYFLEDQTLGMALATKETVYYREWDITDTQEKDLLIEFFESPSYIKIVHDSKKMMHDLIEYGVGLANVVFDTFIAAYLLHPTNKDYDLAELEELFVGSHQLSSEEQLLGKGKSKKNWTNLEEEVRKQEIGKRAMLLTSMAAHMKEKLVEENMLTLFEEIEMPLIEVLFDMEIAGISVDPQGLKQYGEELEALLNQISEAIYEEAGEVFNINSPKQLGVILFEKMGIPPVKKTKTGYSTAAEVLEVLSKDYPIVDKILEYRQYAKLKSTYVEGLLAVMTEQHKIHSTFNQTITATGRLSSTEPNLQNIPVKFEMGKKIRSLFIPSSKDYVFLDGDYSQIELRLLAHISGDQTLIDAFKHDVDIHALTASQVFHVPFEEVSPLQRSNAKAVNFGIVYGISAFALAEDLRISQKEAQRYIDGYFTKYPQIRDYIDNTIAYAMEHGYVETLYHRKREIPEILASNYNLREFGKRVAMNTPIQGTAADLIKIAMIRVHHKLKALNLRSKLILTVHDELLIETHREEIEVVKQLLKEEMEQAGQFSVPLHVDVHQGENWLAVK
ncbi:MAG: DNA polymerase I [Cellulosilyticum sp.]|nr:DNA polymerase I [Cellulosilyticum sp.]